MPHYCKSILIHCMDFRLIQETRAWMEGNGLLGDCDVVSLAGASKEIADGAGSGRGLLLKQINISRSLHKVRRVILLHHSDCGAYKASYKFKNAQEEKEKQLSDMQKAEEIIKKKFLDIAVIKIWAEMGDAIGRKIKFDKI